MSLKYMKVSLFEISYKKNWTFSWHSNLLRCTCILGVARYMYSYQTVTVQASRFGSWGLTTNTGNSPPIQKEVPAAMQRCLITSSRRTENSNVDTEAGALMFGSLYFILIKYQLAVKLAMLELMCVRECVRAPARSLQLFPYNLPAESTLNTYCLINNHCIKVCFYLCTLTMKTNQILYI